MRKSLILGGVAALSLVLGPSNYCKAVHSTVAALLADTDKDEKKEKEIKVEIKDLPAAVTEAIKKAMPDGKITEAEKEMKGGKTIYSLDVTNGGKEYDVEVSEDGKILKTEEEKDAKNEKKESK